MTWRIGLGLSLLAATIFGAATTPRAADEAPSKIYPQFVAVCDYDWVVGQSNRLRTGLEQFKVGTNKAEQELQALAQQVQRLEEEVRGLLPGSPDHLKLNQEATLKKHELQARIEIERNKYEEKRVALEKEVMTEADEVTKYFATKNNITLVLSQSRDTPKLHDLQATERHRKRSVIYSNPGVDISTMVLGKMNDDHAERVKNSKEPEKKPAPGDSKPATPAKQ